MTHEAWVVCDLGFGDAGKGSIVDYLVRRRDAGLVVRFNGGAQAGHNVVTPGGRHHTFSQFGSGAFVAGVRTLLGPGCVLHPGGMLEEERHLSRVGVEDGFERTVVDRRALVVTPFQQAAGRLRELLRGDAAHGSCGLGIGEAVEDALTGRADSIRVGELANESVLRRKLTAQQARKRRELTAAVRLGDAAEIELELLTDELVVGRTLDRWRRLSSRLDTCGPEETLRWIRGTRSVIFEGAQGALLDQDYGFHPHTTWSDCTPAGALALLEGAGGRVFRVGVTRAYMVRHGPGPFPTAERESDGMLPEPHNDDEGWQGVVRRGALDLVLLRYAKRVAGPLDGLAVTCLDRVVDRVPLGVGYVAKGGAAASREVYRAIGAGDLLPPPADDLDARQELTRRLFNAQPRLETVDRGELPGRLEQELEVPVWIESHGPTWRDKLLRLARTELGGDNRPRML